MDADAAWEQVERDELAVDGVTPGTGFGRSSGLRVGGRIYAIRHPDGLVLKLPEARVGELIEADDGQAWGPGPGRLMREWVAVGEATCGRWAELAAEARRFVSG